MKKLLLLTLLLSGCYSSCMSPRECHDMCYPRGVDRYDKDGCICVDKKFSEPGK